jgi:hypothetical protein
MFPKEPTLSPYCRPLALVAAILAGVALCAAPSFPQDSKPQPAVVSQQALGDMACGPCALYNAFAQGSPELRDLAYRLPGDTPTDRVRSLIQRYGSKASETYRGTRTRFTPVHGLASADGLALANDWLEDYQLARVWGDYLERAKDETGNQHLRRVHALCKGSLAAGLPPVLELRSFAARPYGKDYRWDALAGHLVALVEIQPALAEGEKGFSFRFADSLSGRVEFGYLHLEEARSFAATKRFTVSAQGKEQWEWLAGFPYLQVTAPSLRLLTDREPWHARTTITLRYALYRKAPSK